MRRRIRPSLNAYNGPMITGPCGASSHSATPWGRRGGAVPHLRMYLPGDPAPPLARLTLENGFSAAAEGHRGLASVLTLWDTDGGRRADLLFPN